MCVSYPHLLCRPKGVNIVSAMEGLEQSSPRILKKRFLTEQHRSAKSFPGYEQKSSHFCSANNASLKNASKLMLGSKSYRKYNPIPINMVQT